MEFEWSLAKQPDTEVVEHLRSQLGIHPTLCALLAIRGIDNFNDARSFFRYSPDDLHDPFEMKGMQLAVDRISQALEENEHILVYGDYDVDGSTAVSLFYSFLKKQYENVSFYIPDRYSEGYGLSKKGVEEAEKRGASVMVTLDCGIRATEMVELANEKGIDVIICDHHLPGQKLPQAWAILDPKQENCEYPFKELSGCGIGFKLAQALNLHLGLMEDESQWLDLVAISTACDIVPMVGENRVLAGLGLSKINEQPRPGIKAMIDSRNREGAVSISDLVFFIGPRINAAGRIEHAHNAVELLLAEDEALSKSWLEKIETSNTDRKQLDESITEEALEALNSCTTEHVTVVHSSSWHKGVIGIVASRLIESCHRPTIVLTGENGIYTGSARSVEGVNIHDALSDCSQHLEKFGGHVFAAGLTIREEKIPSFITDFDQSVARQTEGKKLVPSISIDLELDFQVITRNLMKILAQMAPFGPGNMPPVFLSRNVMDTGATKLVGKDKKHIQFRLQQAGSPEFKGIGFGMADKLHLLDDKQPADVVYRLQENTWRGTTTIQLEVLDIKASKP